MEVKVVCSCGAKFKFEVQPVNGLMPTAIACPVCQADATDRANQVIADAFASASQHDHAAAAVPPPATVAPPPSAGGGSRLRIAGHASAPATATAESAPVATVAAAPAPAPAVPHRGYVPNLLAAPLPEAKKGNFPLGIAGALVGAGIGMAIWLIVFHSFGLHIKLFALLVGGLTGLGAKLLSRDEGSNELGLIAGVIAAAAIFASQYLIAEAQTVGAFKKIVSTAFEERLKYARETLKAMPNETDAEIRMHLAKAELEEGEKPDVKAVTAEDVATFRKTELPELKALAEGKTTLADYQKEAHTKDIEDNSGVKMFLIVRGLGLFSLTLMIVSVGAAYRLVVGG